MSPNFCLPHSVPCPAGGKRPSSALSICRSHKFAIGRFETSKNASTAWIFVVFERERTIFERSRSPFKVLGLLTSANSIGDWGLAGNSLVTSCSLDTSCMRQCNLFNIRHLFAGNKNSVVLPHGSRSEEKVLPVFACIKGVHQDVSILDSWLVYFFCFYKLAIVSKIERKSVFMYSKKNFCSLYVIRN